MRVLKIVNSHDTGGVYTCEMQFIKEMRTQYVEVDLLILGDGDKLSNYQEACNTYYAAPNLRNDFNGNFIFKIYSLLYMYIFSVFVSSKALPLLRRRYDAVIYRKENSIFLSGILAKKTKAKCIWFMPNLVNNYLSRVLYTRVLFPAYKIIPVANSKYTKKTLEPYCSDVVYPGYDDARVSSGTGSYRKELSIHDSTPIYGVASRLVYDKGIDIVIVAFMRSEAYDNGAHLFIAGRLEATEYVDGLRELAKLSNGRVHLLGELADMAEFFSSVNVVVNGRRNAEPFGITIAEALGAGCPVIAYKLGGPEEMIRHGVNGWLVSEPSVQGFVDCINCSYRDKNRWRDMERVAKESALQFAVAPNVTKLLDIVSR